MLPAFVQRVIFGLLMTMLIISSGCEEDSTSFLVVHLQTTLRVPDDIDGVRIEALGSDGSAADSEFSLRDAFPHSLVLRSARGLNGTLRLRIRAFKNGQRRLQRVVTTRLERSGTSEVRVELTPTCLDVACFLPDADCITGRCVPEDPRKIWEDAAVGCDPVIERCDNEDNDCDGEVDEFAPCVGDLVLSEVDPGGPGGDADEFVELYNRAERPLSLEGVRLEYQVGSGGAWQTRAELMSGDAVVSGGFFLLGNAGYQGGRSLDHSPGWTTGLATGGGHLRLMSGMIELDRMGWGNASMPEGGAVSGVARGNASYERKARPTSSAESMLAEDAMRGNGQDSNDNAADFYLRQTRDPQNTLSGVEQLFN